MSDQPAYLRVEEAAEYLGIGRTFAYRLANRGELPGTVRLGRLLRVHRATLDAEMARRAAGEDASP
ncbi:MAG: helix-turn-helix domain-containing protein [Chloroflexi bacterium]|nr:helix-turn-helix domain-containing protein [Chloroflexota bacterium]